MTNENDGKIDYCPAELDFPAKTEEIPVENPIKIVNAQIDNVFIGFNDREMFFFRIDFNAESERCRHHSFDVRIAMPKKLRNKGKLKQKENWFGSFLHDLFDVLECREFSELVDTYVRIECNTDFLARVKVYKIGHITKNRWLTLDFGKIIYGKKKEVIKDSKKQNGEKNG